MIKESPLFWPANLKKNVLHVLDETLIPKRLHYIKVKDVSGAVKVIKDMKTRAFGQLLVVLNAFLLETMKNKKLSDKKLFERLCRTATLLNKSRPTFPFAEVTGMVIGYASISMKEGVDLKTAVNKFVNGYLQGIRFKRIKRIENIARIIKDGDSILTHCNVSGELAMATAICKKQKKQVNVFATETRPYMQGAKLTTWELMQMGTKVTLIADNAIASVMSDGLVNKVIVGSDRSCANGDFANKIGTYQIAVLAKEFEIPFYVLTQPSNKVKKGEDIPIEIRDQKELLVYDGKRSAPRGVNGFYPGFDVVPHKYVTEAIPINVNVQKDMC